MKIKIPKKWRAGLLNISKDIKISNDVSANVLGKGFSNKYTKRFRNKRKVK